MLNGCEKYCVCCVSSSAFVFGFCLVCLIFNMKMKVFSGIIEGNSVIFREQIIIMSYCIEVYCFKNSSRS